MKTTCRMQHLGCYLEGQGHSMTLQQNRVRPITLLFEVGYYNYFWQTTSLCLIPIRGGLLGLTGSCLDWYHCIHCVFVALCSIWSIEQFNQNTWVFVNYLQPCTISVSSISRSLGSKSKQAFICKVQRPVLVNQGTLVSDFHELTL